MISFKRLVSLTSLFLVCLHGRTYAQNGNHQPYVNYWFPSTLLTWNAATDTAAPFNRATVPLASRFYDSISNPCGVVNTRSPKLKLAALSTLHSTTSFNPSQAYDHAGEYTFGYWQYLDYLVVWGGSAGEGLILAPNSTYINAAHKNGVKILGNIFFPPTVYGGQIAWVNDMLQQDASGNFIVADKLIQMASYYGFDGFFINQETGGGNAALGAKMIRFMKYFQAHKPANMEVMWYDAMLPTGAVTYQNALNTANVTMFDSAGVVSNSIFLNYNWSSTGLTNSATKATSVGRNPFDVYAGIDVSGSGYGTSVTWSSIFPTVGTPKVSVGLFNPNWTFSNSPDKNNIPLFYQREENFWLGANSSPCSIPSSGWPGFAKYYNEKSVISSWPFITRFNTGQGTDGFWVGGNKLSASPWNNLSAQDVLPTWRWVAKSSGTPLSVDLDFTTAYNGGNSLVVSGLLNSANTTLVKLYATGLTVTASSSMSVTYKTGVAGASNMQVALTFADAPTTYVYLNTDNLDSAGWQITTLPLSAYAGRIISSVGLNFQSTTAISNYKMNVGEIALLNGTATTPAAPTNMSITSYVDCQNAELNVYYDTSVSTNVWYYDIYRIRPDNSRQWLGRTPGSAFYVKNIQRIDNEATTSIAVVAVNAAGSSSTSLLKTFNWPANPTNYAINMNGSNQYISTGDINLDSAGVTMEGYIKVTAFKAAAPYTATIMSIDSTSGIAQLQVGNAAVANKVQFNLNIGGTLHSLTSAATLTTGTWYHVAGTYDGAYMRIFINGVVDDSIAATGYVAAKGPLYIGVDSTASATSFFNGAADELRIWKIARTASQISGSECAVTAVSTGLSASWTFNDCNTVIPFDNSGNGHNGTPVNMTSANWVSPAPCANVGIAPFAGNDEVRIYPNPVLKGNDLTLAVPADMKGEWLIYDQAGHLLHQQSITGQLSVINVADLAAGVYFYKIINSDQVLTGKFIVLL